MRKYLFLLLFLTLALEAKRIRVDGIKAIIYGDGENDTVLVTESEIGRAGLDAQPRTLKSIIDEALVYLDAKRIGFVFSVDDVNKYWEDVKKQDNLSEAEMQKKVAPIGTVQEVKELLGRMLSINQMFDFKVRSNLFITQQDVETYYNAHPEFRQAEYCISRAVIPFSDLEPKQEMKQRLEDFVATKKGTVRLAWSDPFWTKHSYVAEDKQFIYNMAIGEISQPMETFNGFEFFKLVDKKPERLVPLKERYDEIAALLKRPKYEQLMHDYLQSLYEKMTIVYL